MNTRLPASRIGCPQPAATGFDRHPAAIVTHASEQGRTDVARRVAAAVMCLALPLSAAADASEPGSFLDRLAQQQRDVQSRLQQPQWENRWLPAERTPVAASESADRRLQAIIAGYTRQALDRGGWFNPCVDGTHYTAPHPLVAVPVGHGATTAGAVVVPAARYASR
jgi:hypothetical protein